MEMCQRKKKQLAPLLILAMLIIASFGVAVEGKPVHDMYTPWCIGKCYKTGNCMRCCKHFGHIHGRCSLIHGMGCYCWYDPAALRRRYHKQQTVTAPPPSDHRLHA
ncbi:hypothetical protein CFC21_087585 [Triticum aestivum]|uniref:Knottin scorpion toxin-like domain-containing protein n=2 Tax=Triticum aestivum TaxID=4565 RepID=A0A9R1LAM4_WHEAT|nr:uncharacterized protein LOC119321068 [Triticum dicoccoides]XP_044409245.1 uncharacterized protein LOC123133928 [Triticum aestivum]KAF7083842.1 hypothetical protein CFC21_087585 [Triticum aestivum]